MNHLSIGQMGDAIPVCNLLIKTRKGTVMYNGPYDKAPDWLLEVVPDNYIYAPIEKTIKITMPTSSI